MRLLTVLLLALLAAALAPASALAANPPGALRFFEQPGPPPAGPDDPKLGSCVSLTLDAGIGSHACAATAPSLEGAYGVALSPDGDSAYVASLRGHAVTAFTRDSTTGRLTPGGCLSDGGRHGCVAGAGLLGATTVAVSPDGANVYVGSREADAVSVFRRDAATGALTQEGLDDPSTTGNEACVAEAGAGGCVAARGLDHAAGLLVSPDGKNLYVAGRGSDGVSVFARGSLGRLEQLPDGKGCFHDPAAASASAPGCTPAQALDGAYGVTTDADGRHVYVTARVADGVAAFVRDPADGSLTPVADDPATAGDDACLTRSQGTCVHVDAAFNGPARMALGPGGGNAYLVSYASFSIATLTRDAASGRLSFESCFSDARELDRCQEAPALAYPTDVAVSPDGTNVYVSSRYRSAIGVFRRRPDGTLRREPAPAGRTWSESCLSWRGHTWWQAEDRSAPDHSDHRCARGLGLYYPSSIALSPDGSDLYVASWKSHSVTDLRRIAASPDWSPDDAAPDTAIAGAPSAPVRGRSLELDIAAGEPQASLWCRLDAAPWRRCPSRHTLSGLADGAHAFEARAGDTAGNIDATPARAVFTVDTSAPAPTPPPPAAVPPPGSSPPRASPAHARRSGRGRAVLRADVLTGALPTTAFFEYGRTPAYGRSTAVRLLGAATHTLALREELAGLRTGVAYHYRPVAMNAAGSASGSGGVFVDLPAPGRIRGAWLHGPAAPPLGEVLRRGLRMRAGCTTRCSVELSLTAGPTARRPGLTRLRRLAATSVRIRRAGEKTAVLRVGRSMAPLLREAAAGPVTLRVRVRDRRGRAARAAAVVLRLADADRG